MAQDLRTQRLQSNANLDSKMVSVGARILSQNDKKANELREIYQKNNLYVINLMSSPGSGKTSFLESLSTREDCKFCVLEGDLQTNRDAKRLQDRGIKAHQITTGEACHLDAKMIENGLSALEKICDFKTVEYLFIENVGNLVCPASYDLGAALNIVFLSTPEGDDKILKYPSMFLCADIVVVSKWDLAEVFGFNLEQVKSDLESLNKQIPIFCLSTKDNTSIQNLKNHIQKMRQMRYTSKHIF